MAVRQVEISGQNFISAMLNSFSNLYPSTGDKSSPTYTGGTNTLSIVPATNVETVIFDNSVFKITGQINSNDNIIITKFYYNNVLIDSQTTTISPGSFGAVFLGWSFLVDDDVQEGQFVYDIQFDYYGSTKYASSFMFSSSSSYRNRRQKAYLAITESEVSGIVANGGGATHIAKITGLLSTLSSNLSDILMVSGGGGGGMLSGDAEHEGADAGGISGSGTLSGNQSTGYGFGQGEAGSNTSAGGGGLYGGYKGTSSLGGGAGSGYIGNDLVSEKKMVGYNVPTSDVESTKTESTTLYSEGIMSDAAKMGDGGAKISFVRGEEEHTFESIIRQTDVTHKKISSSWSIGALREYFNTDWNLEYDMWSRGNVLTKVGEEYSVIGGIGDYYYVFQFDRERYITKIEFDLKIPSNAGRYAFMRLIPMWYDEENTYNSKMFQLQKNSTASYDNVDVLIPTDKEDYGHYSKTYDTPQRVSLFRLYFDVGDYYFKNIKIWTI